jgi:hypothetical protein
VLVRARGHADHLAPAAAGRAGLVHQRRQRDLRRGGALAPPTARPADRARVSYENGSVREVGNLSALDGVGVYGPTDASGVRTTAVEPLDVEPLDTGIYRRVGPRSSVSSTFDSPPAGVALFVVVTGPDGVYLWATGTCGEGAALNAFGVELRDVGPGLSVGCEAVDVETR